VRPESRLKTKKNCIIFKISIQTFFLLSQHNFKFIVILYDHETLGDERFCFCVGVRPQISDHNRVFNVSVSYNNILLIINNIMYI